MTSQTYRRTQKEDIEALVFHTSFLRARQVEVDEGIITREDAEAQVKVHNEQWEKRKEKNGTSF